MLRENQNKFEGFYEFQDQVMSWARECSDHTTKIEIMNFCIELLDKYKSYDDACKGYDNIQNIKQEIFIKWGKHIPDLQKEIRDSKLNQILNN